MYQNSLGKKILKTITMSKLLFLITPFIFLAAFTCAATRESVTINQINLKSSNYDNEKNYLDFIGYSNLQPVFRNRKNNQVVKLGSKNELKIIIDSSIGDYEPFYYCDQGYCKVLKANRTKIIIHTNNMDYNFTLPTDHTNISFSSKMDTMYYDDVNDDIIKYFIIKTNKTLSTQIKGYGPIICKGYLYYTRSLDDQDSDDVEVALFKSSLNTNNEIMILDDLFEDGWRISPDSKFLLYCLGDGYRLYNTETKLITGLKISLDTKFNIVYYDYMDKNFVFMNGSDLSKKIISLNE
jgi:hypothetical protein